MRHAATALSKAIVKVLSYELFDLVLCTCEVCMDAGRSLIEWFVDCLELLAVCPCYVYVRDG